MHNNHEPSARNSRRNRSVTTMNKKGMELAISTLILIVLGIAILIALIFSITGGFDKFKSSTNPFLDSNEAQAVKIACQNACNNNVKITYCCNQYEVGDLNLFCNDSKLEIPCDIDCSEFSCE